MSIYWYIAIAVTHTLTFWLAHTLGWDKGYEKGWNRALYISRGGWVGRG